MDTVDALLVAVVAAIHVYILVLEMFLWRTPRGLKAFGTDQAFADRSATLAANQGLYNGFLAAGSSGVSSPPTRSGSRPPSSSSAASSSPGYTVRRP